MKTFKSIVLIFFLTSFSNCDCNRNRVFKDPQDLSFDTTSIFKVYENQFEMDCILLKNVQLLTDENASIYLNELILDGPKLFLFISELACLNCVEDQFKYIANNLSSKVKMIILCRLDQIRGIYSKLNNFGLDFPVYAFYGENMGFVIESHPGPFYFMTDGTREVRKIYEPIFNNEVLSAMYFETITQQFFSHSYNN